MHAWHLHLLHTILPHDLATLVQQISPCLVDDILDTSWIWSPSPTGEYSVKSAYKDQLDLDGNWGWLWKLHLPANIQFFLWQLCNSSVSVREVLRACGIPMTDPCPVGTSSPKTIAHCFFMCPQAAQVWHRFDLAQVMPLSFGRGVLPLRANDAIHVVVPAKNTSKSSSNIVDLERWWCEA